MSSPATHLAQSSSTPATFVVEPFEGGLRIRCAASLGNIDAADAAVTDFIAKAHAPVNLFTLRLLVREAMLNAVTHGSGEDASREVRLALHIAPHDLILTVEDDGPGFAWQNCGADWDSEGLSGRGLALMRIYASSMTFNTLGNRIELRCGYERLPEASDEGSR